MEIKNKPIEVFCGTGGVGKTTLASTRAYYLAKGGQKVLLITIDPAKRLKQILGIDQAKAGEVCPVQIEGHENVQLDALLMNPTSTMNKIAKRSGVEEIESNRILKILSKPYGGLNEILSIIELSFQNEKNIYDTIVLDTPPGSHFMDFLESCSKITAFFDKSFMDIFAYLGKKVGGSKGSGIFKKIVSSGVKKLLGYLQAVTGADFVEDFIDAISAIYQAKGPFLSALSVQDNFKKVEASNWFLITSVDQDKIQEALEIKNQAGNFFHTDTYLLVNKSLKNMWADQNFENPIVEKIKNSSLDKENKIQEKVKTAFEKTLYFNEVISNNPKDHVNSLINNWGTV